MKIVLNVQKRLINNVSEETNARNIVFMCSLCLQLLEKVKNTLNSKSMPNQDLFQARSGIKFGESCMG